MMGVGIEGEVVRRVTFAADDSKQRGVLDLPPHRQSSLWHDSYVPACVVELHNSAACKRPNQGRSPSAKVMVLTLLVLDWPFLIISKLLLTDLFGFKN